jgi:hypothetical protein
MSISDSNCICPICRKSDKYRNMVTASISQKPYVNNETGEQGHYSWQGQAHLECIRKYNRTNEPKYSILEYDEKNKYVGEATPI